MRYLLDVNTLLALAHTGHSLHGKAAPQSITDGHLLELAKQNSMHLVTLDKSIPKALFIG